MRYTNPDPLGIIPGTRADSTFQSKSTRFTSLIEQEKPHDSRKYSVKSNTNSCFKKALCTSGTERTVLSPTGSLVTRSCPRRPGRGPLRSGSAPGRPTRQQGEHGHEHPLPGGRAAQQTANARTQRDTRLSDHAAVCRASPTASTKDNEREFSEVAGRELSIYNYLLSLKSGKRFESFVTETPQIAVSLSVVSANCGLNGVNGKFQK